MLLGLIIPEGPTIFHPYRINTLRSQYFAMPQPLALEFQYQDPVFPVNSQNLMGRMRFNSSTGLLLSSFFCFIYLSFTSDISVVQEDYHGKDKRTLSMKQESRLRAVLAAVALQMLKQHCLQTKVN